MMIQTTKRHIISALLLTCFTLPLTAATEPACIMAGGCVRPDPIMPKEKSAPAEPLELSASAPDRHIVVPGDTLWGLAALFLKQPYRWPELWQLNRHEIKNPHRIYPGQVVYLDRSGATPRLRIGNPLEGNDASTVKLSPKVLATDNRSAIPAIPPKAIEPFLARPLVIEAGALDQAARIIATQEDRVVVGAGNTVYATGIGDTATVWQVYRPGRSLIDPENQQILGHEAFYLGAARLIRPGEPATLEILNSTQEIGL
ncbi:MAG: LysM peptidoglycan-binding domain-containing protein, partial [Sterolibacterium sp.]|nr:LysM peptidoglycan-binding domain-containing protein [Sterolibacterium sp.]